MKEKMLKEKGGTKVYVIVIVVLVILCAALGAFAVINMNKDKEDDDEKTSKKNETNTSKNVDNETKNDAKNRTDDDDDDDDNNSTVKYSGTIDMTKLMGTDELEDTVWTLEIEGDDDTLSKMVIKAELEKYFKQTFEDAVGDSDAYTYKEFVDLIHEQLDSTMASLGTQMTSGFGVSASKIDTDVSWVDDETLEIEIDLSKTKRSDYKGIDDDESVIEFVVESLEDEGIKMKKSK